MIHEGTRLLLVDSNGKKYVVKAAKQMLEVGGLGVVDGVALCDADFGDKMRIGGRDFIILKPSTKDLLGIIERRAQIMIPKDSFLIPMHLDLGSGSRVIEGGVGSGALTIVLLKAVSPSGKVYSYEFRMAVQVSNLLVEIAPLPITSALAGEVTFKGTSDGDVRQVEVRIDNRSWEKADDTSNNSYRTWQYTLNTTGLSNGVHRFEARAFDGSRYSTLSGLEFSVLNPKKPGKPAARFIPGMEAALLAVAGAAAIASTWRRRMR